jgi:hypothetical protein
LPNEMREFLLARISHNPHPRRFGRRPQPFRHVRN